MRTPAGTECPYFFGDYHRGRNQEQCNLIGNVSPPNNWKPSLCKTCQVPSIIRANGCKNMKLAAEVKPGVLRKGGKVKITAFCTKSHQDVKQPHIGCGFCHEPFEFQLGDQE